MLLLVLGSVLIVVGCILQSYSFYLETCRQTMPLDLLPMASFRRSNLPLLLGLLASIIGVVLLFILKWYAGIAGIAGDFVLTLICHEAWLRWMFYVNRRE